MEAADRNLWALGRIGARSPFHGSAHAVVPAADAAAERQAFGEALPPGLKLLGQGVRGAVRAAALDRS